MTYRMTTTFETVYTKEREIKIEYTTDRAAAIRAFGIYMENPEVISCMLDKVPSTTYKKAGKIIAVYNPF